MRSRRRQARGSNIGCVVSGLGASGPPGSKSRACSHRGCRGTWEIPHVSPSVSRRQRIEAPALYRRGAGNSNSPLPRDEQQSVVPPKRTKGSGAGRRAGSRSALIVPVKLANRRPREPVEGRGAPDHGIVEGKHSETSCSSSSVSTERRRIADQGCGMQQTVIRGAGCGNPARPDLQGGRGKQSPRSTRPDRIAFFELNRGKRPAIAPHARGASPQLRRPTLGRRITVDVTARVHEAPSIFTPTAMRSGRRFTLKLRDVTRRGRRGACPQERCRWLSPVQVTRRSLPVGDRSCCQARSRTKAIGSKIRGTRIQKEIRSLGKTSPVRRLV
jgi:hypothetical protein